LPTNWQNFTLKDLTEVNIFQKSFRGYFFETPCILNFPVTFAYVIGKSRLFRIVTLFIIVLYIDGAKILQKILTFWVGRNNVKDDRHRRTAHAIRLT